MLDVERVSQFVKVLAVIVRLRVVDGEIEVDILEVKKAAEVLVGRGGAHGVELLGTRPC